MSRIDECHDHVVNALTHASWTVSPKPYTVRIDRVHRVLIDISASQSSNGNQQSIMVVEVKCFSSPSTETTDLYTAIGQYLVYRALMQKRGVTAPLYLAVPTHAYAGVFDRMAKTVIQENHVKILVIDMEREVIVQWPR